MDVREEYKPRIKEFLDLAEGHRKRKLYYSARTSLDSAVKIIIEAQQNKVDLTTYLKEISSLRKRTYKDELEAYLDSIRAKIDKKDMNQASSELKSAQDLIKKAEDDGVNLTNYLEKISKLENKAKNLK